MAGKSQQELEKPAKVYQVDAVETKVDQALALLQTISAQTTGVINQTQLDTAIAEVLKEAKDHTNNEVKLVNADYGPLKRTIVKFAWIIITAIVAQVGVAVAMVATVIAKLGSL